MSGTQLPAFEGQPVTLSCNAFTWSVPEELALPFSYFWFIDGTRYRLGDSLTEGHRLNSTRRQPHVSGLTLKEDGRLYSWSVQEKHSDYESDRSEEETVVVRSIGNYTLEDFRSKPSFCGYCFGGNNALTVMGVYLVAACTKCTCKCNVALVTRVEPTALSADHR